MKKWVSNFEATRKNSHQERLDGSSVCPDRLAISIVLTAFYSDQNVGIIEGMGGVYHWRNRDRDRAAVALESKLTQKI